MKAAITYGPMCIGFKGAFDMPNLRTDPRGLTGSEIGFIRIAECLKELEHDVTMFAASTADSLNGIPVKPLEALHGETFDFCVSINEPDTLRLVNAKVRVCEFWLNEFNFCRPGFEDHVDLFVSPSPGHLEQVLTNPDWRTVGVNGQHPKGAARYEPDPEKWKVIELGCDPERYDGFAKVPGRVVYCSSPDRGLHLLLQEWPRIKRAVPHAHLRIFYRLRPWIDGFAKVGYHPPIESLRSRALYIEEALRRMQGPEWGIEVLDSVSREQIEREMCEAEVLAYPCSTTSWSEGFSCTILEACAARACPIITDCDGLPSVYGGLSPISRSNITGWRERVINVLQDADYRSAISRNAYELATRLTWKNHTKRLEAAILEHLQPEKERVTELHIPV